MKCMIRKPEYIKDAECSRIFPNTAAALLITLAVLAAYFIASLIAGLIYAVAARSSLPKAAGLLASQGIIVFSLYFEALLIAFMLIYVRFIEKRPLRSIGLTRERFAARYAAGFCAGFVLLALYAAPALLATPVKYEGITWLAALYLGAFAVQSAAEEIVFRGYVMSALMRRGGAAWAVLISALVFTLVHIPGSSLGVAELLPIFLLGAMFALYTLRTGSLWGAFGFHAAWNFFTGCVSPVPLGPNKISYSALSGDFSAEQDAAGYIMATALFLFVISLLLFAGRNRLVVARAEKQKALDYAIKIMKGATKGYREFRQYALRVAETAKDDAKQAALLHYAVRCGYPPEMVRYNASPDVAAAVDALMPRASEGPNDYYGRVSKDPIASAVKEAEQRLADMMAAQYARR
ncbi:MAG: lysostaphin resistance A-like protein [Burkholderiales bacterium]